jgi:hypothetical protein
VYIGHFLGFNGILVIFRVYWSFLGFKGILVIFIHFGSILVILEI